MNVMDKYKSWSVDDIRKDVKSKTFNYAVLMENWGGDFNQACLIRSANAFGADKVFYLKKSKRWDKRAAVGTYHYTDVEHLSTVSQVRALKEKYILVGIENNIEGALPLNEIDWANIRKDMDNKSKDLLFVFGEEACGISDSVLGLCDHWVYIQQYGSVRSLNVASCASIIMHEAVNKLFTI